MPSSQHVPQCCCHQTQYSYPIQSSPVSTPSRHTNIQPRGTQVSNFTRSGSEVKADLQSIVQYLDKIIFNFELQLILPLQKHCIRHLIVQAQQVRDRPRLRLARQTPWFRSAEQAWAHARKALAGAKRRLAR